ncbi:MAG TPA: magnesium/cobalt efflux protein [Spongiibacteraceae bacterium]|nr:magnesium/cobalt efflux protein [Spongiibacteraceae bacterium]HCS26702.1 magnesium/cobalt efflux protein [Spongiibacteraceae bacterium]
MSDDRSGSDAGDKSWIEKIAQAFAGEPRNRDDLIDVLRIARQNEVVDSDVLGIIEGAMNVGDMQAREIMVPRPQMVVIKADQPFPDILSTIIKTAHSRYPVIGENADEVLGILLAKDLLPQLLKENPDQVDLNSILRPATLVPESKRVNVLLRDFREKRNHMAVVIDEYGGVAGLVTIEDVLEQIVGEIEDEYDEEHDAFIRKIADNDFIVKALTPIDEFNEAFKTEFSDDEFDTIGGIILQQLGHLPSRNEVATVERCEFKVINADNRQIHLLRMRLLEDSEQEQELVH